MKLNKFTNLIGQVWLHKSIGRVLMNWCVYDNRSEIRGRVLDLASGSGPSYKKYIPSNIDITSSDLMGTKGVDLHINLNEKLPIADGVYDTVLLFNAIYTLDNRPETLAEIYRILKRGGSFIAISPLMFNEAREPHDFVRLTSEGLEKELGEAGFAGIKLIKIGERFSAAASLLWPFLYFRAVRVLVASVAILLDRIIPAKLGHAHPAPLSYLCIVKKNI